MYVELTAITGLSVFFTLFLHFFILKQYILQHFTIRINNDNNNNNNNVYLCIYLSLFFQLFVGSDNTNTVDWYYNSPSRRQVVYNIYYLNNISSLTQKIALSI